MALVRWFYRVRRDPPELHFARTADGWQIALHRRAPQVRRFREPVLLCHGLSTSHLNFDFDPPYSLAHHLAERGFECFSLDLRGAGLSRPPRRLGRYHFSIDDHIRFDAPAAIAEALRISGAEEAFWVGHSMGALVGYAAAERGEAERLRGLCALGAPVFFAFEAWMRRALAGGVWLAWPSALRQRVVGLTLAPFLGHVTLPLSDVVLNPKAVPPSLQRKLFATVVGEISRGVLAQFADWIGHDAFRSKDGALDYREGLKGLRVPALILGGSADRLARPAAIRGQFELLGAEDKTLMIFGPENGDTYEYGHGDLIFGERAPKEVYPRIAAWLEARATPV
jgi:pimeloyl-ACP methyl ester carboxylesterase